MIAASVYCLISSFACQHERSDMVSDPPPTANKTTSPAAATADTAPAPAADAAPGPAAPSVDLGPGLQPIAFASGRYAVVIQRMLQGGHAAQRLRQDSTASLVLDLAADGGATACRGWRYNAFNDGPTVHTEERFREQWGFRGTYAVKGEIAEVELSADDSVCPAVREYGATTPRRAAIMKLRCVLATPHDHPSLHTTALLCQWLPTDPPAIEADAYRVDGVIPNPWLVLGSGPGLRIKVTGKPTGARTGEPMKVDVQVAPAPLPFDAWAHPF